MRSISLLSLAFLILLPTGGLARDCSGLPTSFSGNEFPTGDFFKNFDNDCYLIDLSSGGNGSHLGDLNSIYNTIYYKLDARYELILVGEFPQVRYMDVTVNDDHSAYVQTILDKNIVPLESKYVNPFAPGVAYVPRQKYAVPISFGGTPGAEEKGCMLTRYNVDVNMLDATLRHQGINWNLDPGFTQKNPQYPNHEGDTAEHTHPNTAGGIYVRNYLPLNRSLKSRPPQIIVRDVASGCAYPKAYVESTIQNLTTNNQVANGWRHEGQISAHTFYARNYLPWICYAPSQTSQLQWRRNYDYVAAGNPDSAYLLAAVPSGLPHTLAAAGEVLRLRFRLPRTPPTPCANGCSRDGTEQIRYVSLSFDISGGKVLASLADSAFTRNANDDVTLIVGTGAAVPSWVTAANGYTYLDLTKFANYEKLVNLELRNILPSPGYHCAGQVPGYDMFLDMPDGANLMGPFLPQADYPSATSLPHTAGGLPAPPGGCDAFPNGDPDFNAAQSSVIHCGVSPSPAISISAVSSQCSAPNCHGIVAQAQPPINLTGAGFGSLPNGMPYTGDSTYLEVRNLTQGWDAGNTSDVCKISIVSWATHIIQAVADLKPEKCPLNPGDKLAITVTNPESMKSASVDVTASAN